MPDAFDMEPIIVIKDSTITDDNPTGDTEMYMLTKSQIAVLKEQYNYPDTPAYESNVITIIQNYV